MPAASPDALEAAKAFLIERVGTTVTGIRTLGSGEWSQAFAFEDHGSRYVLRLSKYSQDFEKDRYAAALASPDLPVPRILDIGKTEDGYFAVSEYEQGTPLDDLDATDMATVLPELLRTLNVIASIDTTSTRGFGYWTPDGAGTSTSWRQSLLKVGTDPPGSRTHGWRKQLLKLPEAVNVFDEGIRRLRELVRGCPERRQLVHSDLLNRNVLVDGTRVTAVIDWGSSKFGDALYDTAWLAFWWPWYEQWNGIDLREAIAPRIEQGSPNAAERLNCYELHIGLEGMAHEAFAAHWDELQWTTQRTAALLEAHG